MKRAEYVSRAEVLKALAHPTRLEIVEILSGGEICVTDIQLKLGFNISTISRHLAELKNAGLVCGVKRGLQVYYRLRRPCVMQFFRCLDDLKTEQTNDVEPVDCVVGIG
jgi:ArsR family transcriptional regulator